MNIPTDKDTTRPDPVVGLCNGFEGFLTRMVSICQEFQIFYLQQYCMTEDEKDHATEPLNTCNQHFLFTIHVHVQ